MPWFTVLQHYIATDTGLNASLSFKPIIFMDKSYMTGCNMRTNSRLLRFERPGSTERYRAMQRSAGETSRRHRASALSKLIRSESALQWYTCWLRESSTGRTVSAIRVNGAQRHSAFGAEIGL